MGLLGGVIDFGSNSNNPEVLRKMLAIQKHRDYGKPVILLGNEFAIGMANSQNNIYSKSLTDGVNSLRAIHAFVDGIVLKSGVSADNASCSEMICDAYEKWSVDFMAHLEGEFACAVWDNKEKKLILARDPYGHKPLHYFADNKATFFSSEIKGILAGGIVPEINLTSLSDFLSLNCIPYPGTIYKNINQVCPGQMVIFSNQGIKFHQYWQPRLAEDKTLSLDDAVVLLTDGIRQAVKKRMVSDNVFCFLSGGIDSSALISFASELSNKPINAVTVSFNEAEANELDDAKAMANYVGAKHYHVTAIPESFFEMLETLVYHHDQPFTDTSSYPSYYAGKLAKQFTDVIMTGDGPDQTMGGSSHHVFAIRSEIFKARNIFARSFVGASAGLLKLIAFEPNTSFIFKLRRNLYRRSLSPVSAAYDVRSYFPDLIKKYISSKGLWKAHISNNPFRHPEQWFKEAVNADNINKYLFADIKFYVPDDLMIKVDRMTMASGLETVSPFQDVKLAEIVSKLPSRFKIKVSGDGKIITKFILREVCKKRFPDVILNKKKQGFGIPLEKWLRQDNSKKLKEILLDPRTLNRGLFHKQRITKFVNDFVESKGDYYYPSASGIVALLTLELWFRRFIDKHV